MQPFKSNKIEKFTWKNTLTTTAGRWACSLLKVTILDYGR